MLQFHSYVQNLAQHLGSENCASCGKLDITYGVILGKDGVEGKCIYCESNVKKYTPVSSLLFSISVFKELAVNNNEVKASSGKIVRDAIESVLTPIISTNKIPSTLTILQFQAFLKAPTELHFGGQKIGGFVKLVKGVPSVVMIDNVTQDQVLGLFAATTAINYLLRFNPGAQNKNESTKTPRKDFLPEFDSKDLGVVFYRLIDDFGIFKREFFNLSQVNALNICEYNIFCMSFVLHYLGFKKSQHINAFAKTCLEEFELKIEDLQENSGIWIDTSYIRDKEYIQEKMLHYQEDIRNYENDPEFYYPQFTHLSMVKHPFENSENIFRKINEESVDFDFNNAYTTIIGILYVRAGYTDRFTARKQDYINNTK